MTATPKTDHWPLIWHRFNTDMSDEDLDAALNPLDVHVIMVEREKGIIWVDKDNSFTPEIQNVLNNWQP